MNAAFSRVVVAFVILPCLLLALALLLVFAPTPAFAQTPDPTGTPSIEEEPSAAPTPTHTPTLIPTPILTAAVTIAAAVAPTGAVTATVLVDALNLRAGPATTFPKLGSARKGDLLTVHGKTAGCAWLRVSTAQGAPAWVSGNVSFVRLNSRCASVALAPTLPIPTPTPQPTLPPTAEPTIDPAAPTASAPEVAPAATVTAAAPSGDGAASASSDFSDWPTRPVSPPPYVPDPSAIAFVLPFVQNPDFQLVLPDSPPEDPDDFFAFDDGSFHPVFGVDQTALACTRPAARHIRDTRISYLFERVGSGGNITVIPEDVTRGKGFPDDVTSICLQPGTYRYSFISERVDAICVTTGGEIEVRAGDVYPTDFFMELWYDGDHYCFPFDQPRP